MFFNKSTLIDMSNIGKKDNFKQSMIDVYTNLTNNMPDNGLQVLMFNHSKLETWADMLDIVKESGLYITAVYPVGAETRMKQHANSYNCVMLLICRKRNFEYDFISEEEALSLYKDVEKDLVVSMDGVELNNADETIFKWVKGLKVLSNYTYSFDSMHFLKSL